jgi:cytochrome c
MKSGLLLAGLAIAGTALSISASPPSGKVLFENRCAGCHSLDRNKEGPRLRGVFGRQAAAEPSFPYSDALKRSNVTWDEATLNQWLTDPEELVPGTDMSFRVESQSERDAIILWLKENRAK